MLRAQCRIAAPKGETQYGRPYWAADGHFPEESVWISGS